MCHFRFFANRFILPSTLLGMSMTLHGFEIKLGQNYSDLPLDQSGTLTSVAPGGTSISLAHDINDSFRLSLDYIDWDKTHISGKLNDLTIDSTSYAATLSYFVDNFALSANYTYWQSDYSETLIDLPIVKQSTYAPSYGVSLGYGIFWQDWVIEPAISLQYNEWRYRDKLVKNDLGFSLSDSLEDESVVISGLLSASKVVQMTEEEYLLIGGIMRWNTLFHGDGPEKPEGVLSFAGRQSHTVNSDDDFAELSFFITYDITAQWMIELDTSVAFLPQDNYSSFSWRVGYRF